MINKYYGITIDEKRDELLTSFSRILLEQYYMIDEESSPQQAFARAAIAYCEGEGLLKEYTITRVRGGSCLPLRS